MLSFRRAQTVAAGEKPTSTVWNSLAQAFNDRLLSGVADGAWRIVWMMMALVRSPRNPGINFQWAPEDEWMKVYGLLDQARNPGCTWPIEANGDPEGLNLAWPMAAFVYGVENFDLEAEAQRLNEEDGTDATGVPMTINDASPQTLGDHWLLAKYQRGGIDPSTGEQRAPASAAAQEHFKIGYHWNTPMLKTYGGYFPSRPELGDCGDATASAPATQMFEVVFTHKRTGDRLVYSGFCPDQNSTGAQRPDALWGFYRTPFYYYVYPWSGSMFLLPVSDWMEGPYTGGGVLGRGQGEQLGQVLHRYLVTFRGSDAQRVGNYRIKNIAFPFQEFLVRQYALAPALGQMVSETEMVIPYSRWQSNSNMTSGQLLLLTGSSNDGYGINDGFVAAGAFARATGLRSAVAMEVLVWDRDESGAPTGEPKVFDGISLTPGSTGTAGEAEWLKYWAPLPKTSTGGPPVIAFRLASDLDLESGGMLWVEVAELVDYRPQLWDGYLLLRKASTSGGNSFGHAGSLDGWGNDVSQAKEIGEDFLRYGCLKNATGADLPDADPVGEIGLVYNPLYEAARQMVTDRVRLAAREQFAGYEVVDGKSVLHFKRYTTMRPGCEADLFAGIADAISHDAPDQGWTNEWCAFFNWNVFHPGPYTEGELGSSNWKPGNYGDVMLTQPQRCHLGSREIVDQRRLWEHYSYAQQWSGYGVVRSEAPPGYIYNENLLRDPFRWHSEATKQAFYGSCQIYQAPYEVETVESYTAQDGTAMVKVTMTGRLQHEASVAPATIANNHTGWLSGFAGATYRTDENGVCEYLHHRATGTQQQPRTGDVALDSRLHELTDGPYGGFYPRMWMVRLMKRVPEDTNDTLQLDKDTRMTVDELFTAELYLRAMCEGYIDQTSTETMQANCEATETFLYDYSFANLMQRAQSAVGVGQEWVSLLPGTVRSDMPIGHGLLPNTRIYAATYNQFAVAVNLLYQARVDLPMEIQSRLERAQWVEVVNPSRTNIPTGDPCSGDSPTGPFSYAVVLHEPLEHGAEWVADPDWTDGYGGGLSASKRAYFYGGAGGAGTLYCDSGVKRWAVQVTKERLTYRVKSESTYLEAVPSAIRELLEGGYFGILGYVDVIVDYWQESGFGDYVACETQLSNGPESERPDLKLIHAGDDRTTRRCMMLPVSGTFEPPRLPEGTLVVWQCTTGNGYANAIETSWNWYPATNPRGGNVFVSVPISG